MKKNRNAFFQESTSFQGYDIPYLQANANYNQFYATNLDYDSRLAKIERSLNRLEYRIKKLEGLKPNITIDEDITNNDMYML